ncbi:hypothetical protein [Bacillus sp. JCM 19034]|uniref:hypothetical protein n=1 Tax=Bacillus sp. JCM 19034 TaxID=1481928 RepID=UPI0009E9A7F3|nr:hypothetical protein [Bacillus sp. JCM 19034]
MTDKQKILALIREWNHDTLTLLSQVKKTITALEEQKKQQIISYFTYSLNLANNDNEDHFIIGTYHIQNLSHTFITNPYICIKLDDESPLHFSGKYVYKPSHSTRQPKGAWEKINDHTNRFEYWLKPFYDQQIKPFGTLSFSNFQLKWNQSEPFSCNVMGFTYCDEYKDGVNALNQIFISKS